MKNISFLILAVIILGGCATAPVNLAARKGISESGRYVFLACDKEFALMEPLLTLYAGDRAKVITAKFDCIDLSIKERGVSVYRIDADRVSVWSIRPTDDQSRSNTYSDQAVYVSRPIRERTIALSPGKISFLGYFAMARNPSADPEDSSGRFLGASIRGRIDDESYADFARAKKLLLQQYPFIDGRIVIDSNQE